MTTRLTLLTFLAAGQLLAAGAAHATGGRPAPARRAPAAAHPAPAAAAAPALLAVAAAAPIAAVPQTQPEAAPTTLRVTGTIVGTDGQPRPGVSVFPTANPRLLAITDAKGGFTLQLPAAAGLIYLQADYFGVGSSRIAIDGQQPQPVHIVLGQ